MSGMSDDEQGKRRLTHGVAVLTGEDWDTLLRISGTPEGFDLAARLEAALAAESKFYRDLEAGMAEVDIGDGRVARIHREGGSYWADVPSLPGCFSAGATLSELREALVEAVRMCQE